MHERAFVQNLIVTAAGAVRELEAIVPEKIMSDDSDAGIDI